MIELVRFLPDSNYSDRLRAWLVTQGIEPAAVHYVSVCKRGRWLYAYVMVERELKTPIPEIPKTHLFLKVLDADHVLRALVLESWGSGLS